jgi:hypothetical protein
LWTLNVSVLNSDCMLPRICGRYSRVKFWLLPCMWLSFSYNFYRLIIDYL